MKRFKHILKRFKHILKRSFLDSEKITTSIRLPLRLKVELERLAESHGRGFSDFAREGLDQWVLFHKDK